MTTTESIDTTQASRVRWANLAGRSHGDGRASGRSFVFLHGLTFDHRMWDPILEALPSDHHAVAFDLPGHGGSPSLPRHDLEAIVDVIHEAVVEAGLEAPIVVGHSIAAAIASLYGVKHRAAAVVAVDGAARVEPVAQLVRSLAGQLRGDEFAQVWPMFRESMHIERVPEPGRELLQVGYQATQEQVLTYWVDLLERTPAEIAAWVDQEMAAARAARLPFLALYGDPIDPDERAFLTERLPQAEIVVWPVGHHFPQLADPSRFATLLTGLAAGLPSSRSARVATRPGTTGENHR